MKHVGSIFFNLFLVLLVPDVSEATGLTEKETKSAPRARVACLPNPTLGVRYPDPDDLGPHLYHSVFGFGEHDGIVCTLRAGHIDITHVRKAADWTAYLAYHCHKTLLANDTQLSFKMREASRYHLRFQYPPDWRSLRPGTREQIAREVSIQLGQYLGYLGSVWHEVLTWNGYRTSGLYPGFQSAFSWEDNYSNALGAHIAGLAMRDPNRPFGDAMACHINRELERLDVQPSHIARQAAEQVKGAWYAGGYFTCDMIKRHFDVGLGDNMMTPWLIPGMASPDRTGPVPCPVPTLDPLKPCGFHVTVEIDVREWERDRILRAVYPNPDDPRTLVEPAKDLPAIMASIRAAAIERYGPNVDEPDVMSLASGPAETVTLTTR